MRGFSFLGASFLNTNLPNIMSRVLNQPLMMEPAYAKTFFAGIASRMGISHLRDLNGEVLDRDKLRIKAGDYTASRNRDRPYRVENGVAVIPVDGTLVNKFGYIQPHSGMTGYDGILTRANQAFSDPEVRGVLLDNDTPGGDVSGCFDCVKSLRKMATAANKPFWSLAYDMNCSAGMAIASAADRRLTTSTGIVGSVGVIMAHASFEKQLAEEGIDVTLIYAGAHKADGNPYQNLSEEVYARFLGQTESLRQEFAQLVSGNIGISLESVLATEARSYRGEDAVKTGLADEVVNGNEAIQIFSEYLSTQGKTISLGVNMSNTVEQPTASTQASSAEAGNTVVEQAQATSTETNESVKASAKAEERARIGAIMGCEEAKGREALANHFATQTDMSIEAAQAALLVSAKEIEPEASHKSALDVVMAKENAPEVGADSSSDVELTESEQEAALAVSMFNQANGIK